MTPHRCLESVALEAPLQADDPGLSVRLSLHMVPIRHCERGIRMRPGHVLLLALQREEMSLIMS